MKNQKTKITFLSAVQDYWGRYFSFYGVSTRAQYWWAVLFVVLINIFGFVINSQTLSILLSIILFIPSRALAFRRFHDVGLSGWWNLAPYMSLLVWWFVRSDTWFFFFNLEYIPTDFKVYALLTIVWCLFNLFILVQPSKKIQNKYRK